MDSEVLALVTPGVLTLHLYDAAARRVRTTHPSHLLLMLSAQEHLQVQLRYEMDRAGDRGAGLST